RRIPSATSACANPPKSSGPRCTMTSHIARTRSGLAGGPGWRRDPPPMPPKVRPPAPAARGARGARSPAAARGSPRGGGGGGGVAPGRDRPGRGGHGGPEAEATEKRGDPLVDIAVRTAAVRVGEVPDVTAEARDDRVPGARDLRLRGRAIGERHVRVAHG